MLKRIIGIDFGTSNSVLGFRDFTADDKGNLKIQSGCVPIAEEGKTIPTLVFEKNGQFTIQKDYYSASCYSEYVVHQNFKMDFLEFANSCNDIETEIKSATPEISVRLTKFFFQHLFQSYIKANNIASQELESNYEIETIVTCPVRTTELQKRALVAVAAYAGFPNVSTLDEAITVMRFALAKQDGVLREKLENVPEGTHLKFLIADMGAGTTDMVLYDYCAGSTFKEADLSDLSWWPRVGSNKFIGGKETDKILFDYLSSSGFLCYKEADKEIVLLATKIAKEKLFSQALLNNCTIDRLGPLADYANDDRNFHRSGGLTKEKFEEIIKPFAQDFILALNELLEDSKEKVCADDIDFVILSGGGSQWYFIDEIIRKQKRFGEKSINLKKVIQNDGLIVSDEPQLMDLYGILTPPSKIRLLPTSWMSMTVIFRIFSYPIAKANSLQQSDYELKLKEEINLIDIHHPLPYCCEDARIPANSISVKSDHRIVVHAALLARGADNEQWKLIKEVSLDIRRTLSRALGNWWNGTSTKTCPVTLKKTFQMDINRRVHFSVWFDVDGYWTWDIAIDL